MYGMTHHIMILIRVIHFFFLFTLTIVENNLARYTGVIISTICSTGIILLRHPILR